MASKGISVAKHILEVLGINIMTMFILEEAIQTSGFSTYNAIKIGQRELANKSLAAMKTANSSLKGVCAFSRWVFGSPLINTITGVVEAGLDLVFTQSPDLDPYFWITPFEKFTEAADASIAVYEAQIATMEEKSVSPASMVQRGGGLIVLE